MRSELKMPLLHACLNQVKSYSNTLKPLTHGRKMSQVYSSRISQVHLLRVKKLSEGGKGSSSPGKVECRATWAIKMSNIARDCVTPWAVTWQAATSVAVPLGREGLKNSTCGFPPCSNRNQKKGTMEIIVELQTWRLEIQLFPVREYGQLLMTLRHSSTVRPKPAKHDKAWFTEKAGCMVSRRYN